MFVFIPDPGSGFYISDPGSRDQKGTGSWIQIANKIYKYISIERLDQGHLYPLGERRDKHVTGEARTSAPQADALPKELSRQLISWLFGTSTWPEAGAAFGPLHKYF